MTVDGDSRDAIAAMEEAHYQDEDDENGDGENEDGAETGEAGTVVTMTAGYGIWWPPNFGPEQERPA
jgi:hypothetical protein